MAKLVRAGRLIDGTSGEPIPQGCLLIEGDRIKYVGPPGGVHTPPGAEVLDLTAFTVLPGLIDAHSHLGPFFGEDLSRLHPHEELYRMGTASRHLRLMLASGVTTMRNPSERSWRGVVCREAVRSGLLAGPRLWVGARGIRPTHGWGQNAFPVDGENSLRRFVRENIEGGADFIKIYASGEVFQNTAETGYMSRLEVRAVVEETHRVGKKVAAHCHGGEILNICLEEGVDFIEHGAMLAGEHLDLFQAHGAWLICTFNPYLHPSALEGERSSAHVEGVRRARANMEKRFPTALRSGIRFTVGTDGRHGNLAFELECLVRFGLSPLEAIQAATRDAAEACEMGDQVGTLEPGKLADLIATEGNPLQDISALHRVRLVMKEGLLYENLVQSWESRDLEPGPASQEGTSLGVATPRPPAISGGLS